MTSPDTATELRFEPPGPGSWEMDPVHFPRPVTRYWTELHPEPFRRGFREFTAYYGMLFHGLEMGYVNGFAYKTIVPLADEEVPARFQRAEEVLEGKLWRDQLREWDETFKPSSIETHRELQAVAPDELSDEELVAYLTRCRDHHAEMIYQHMRHTGAAIVPIGDFLAHVGDWTGLPPADLLGLMRGSAPVSAGASAELERLQCCGSRRPGCPPAARIEGRSWRRARGVAHSRRRRGRRRVRVSRPRRLPVDQRLRHLRAVRARAARRAAEGHPRRRRREHARGLGRRRADCRRPRAGARGASWRVRRVARRGPADVSDP